jgi:uncharacterized RDD family membrane protein YckC
MTGITRRNDSSEGGQLWYAGFWPRLGATFVDGLILAPVAIVSFWLLSHSRAASIALTIPLGLVGPVYEVILLARYGQTVGKMMTRIAVFRISGEPIGWREVFLRCSVQLCLGFLSMASYLYAKTRLPLANWTGGWFVILGRLLTLEPTWGRWSSHAMVIWTYSELITLLFNRKRRALHDFIAGTVVVRVRENTDFGRSS